MSLAACCGLLCLRGGYLEINGYVSIVILGCTHTMQLGIGITVVGLVVVGWSALVGEAGTYTTNQLLFGNGLIIAGR